MLGDDAPPQDTLPLALPLPLPEDASGGGPLRGGLTGPVYVAWEPPAAAWLARRAEHLYERRRTEEAYRLARQAYTADPYDARGLLVYVACLADLAMKTELFYLGHELAATYPKAATSWYTVGCYYLTCKKYEAAQKYLQVRYPPSMVPVWPFISSAADVFMCVCVSRWRPRWTSASPRPGWPSASPSPPRCAEPFLPFLPRHKTLIFSTPFGLVQEESEHAIAAFRAACRLLPGDPRPLVLMAKELVRTNYLALALHLLRCGQCLSCLSPSPCTIPNPLLPTISPCASSAAR